MIPDAAHIGFTKHWLAKAPTGPKLTKEEANDGALLRDVCRKHHHSMDFGRLDLTRSQIPESVERFAREHFMAHGTDLTWKLDRDYGPRLEEQPPTDTRETNDRCDLPDDQPDPLDTNDGTTEEPPATELRADTELENRRSGSEAPTYRLPFLPR